MHSLKIKTFIIKVFKRVNMLKCVCVSCTFSLTRIAEHCRGTPIILCGFHVTEFALQSLIYVLMY